MIVDFISNQANDLRDTVRKRSFTLNISSRALWIEKYHIYDLKSNIDSLKLSRYILAFNELLDPVLGQLGWTGLFSREHFLFVIITFLRSYKN